ncbi:sensor histidine kinase [Paenibacillus hamazuiensis]|uniref:sensor histidine kinase n=1 Tax=Paenibacillus hamazuiensis TaxID=2936508 RepID=UPI00200FD379|nr:histidine kinase [Paenibacillus hamazuiensis]
MHYRWTTYKKIILLVLLLLVPTVILYSYSHVTSVNVIENEIQEASLNRIFTLSSQMDNIVEQLSILSIVVSKDPAIKQLNKSGREKTDPLKQLELQESLVRSLDLLSATSRWINGITIYLPGLKQAYSNDYSGVYNPEYLQRNVTTDWRYNRMEQGDSYFSKFVPSPLTSYKNPLEAESLIEVRFSKQNIVNMLSEFKSENKGEPFLYKAGSEPIASGEADMERIRQITSYLDGKQPDNSGHLMLTLDGEQFIVNYLKNKSLQWYLVDYMPLEQTLKPIFHTRNMFYFAMCFMLGLSAVVAFFLYKQVQVPIRMLMHGVQGIQRGTYSYRLQYHPKNEFEFLFYRFNEMAAEIQRLIETVYKENIRFREAKLKQLQSQINPHFLYNCLFFVKNMIAIDDKSSATAMVLNLAQYYRFITKLESTMTSLGDEMKLVRSYLDIQNLRMERFHYEIDIPDSMLETPIPRLLIQPIVENAIIHGIGNIEGYGIISIEGKETDSDYKIMIDDNGNGLSEEKAAELLDRISRPLDGESGCGLWNVHQRLQLQFNKQEGLQFAASPLGGLRVIVSWGKTIASDSDRRE